MGAGLSGLTAALNLTRKGYQVVVFESHVTDWAVVCGIFPQRNCPER